MSRESIRIIRSSQGTDRYQVASTPIEFMVLLFFSSRSNAATKITAIDQAPLELLQKDVESAQQKDGRMKKRFTDEQIISILKEQEAGERTADVCRRHGISQATFYKYKSRYGGMEPSDAKKLRALETENGRLKKLLAEQMLDNAMLRDVNSKKW